MKIPVYHVDSFTSVLFRGNPAAVCFLDSWLEDRVLLSIAAENSVSETAFLLKKDAGYELRWFAPLAEVALCGHATLASAHVLFEHEGWPGETLSFFTRWSGVLTVARTEAGLEMDFPLVSVAPIPAPKGLEEALGLRPLQVFKAGEDVMAVLESEEAVRALRPRMAALAEIPGRGVMVTASGGEADFVSRFFAPRLGIDEDPATGSAHCALAPYWAERLGKTTVTAQQLSARGGAFVCRPENGRVKLAGKAVLYMKGTLFL